MFIEYLDVKKLQTIKPICLSIWCDANLYKKTTKYEIDENGYKRPTKVRLKYHDKFLDRYSKKNSAENTVKLKKESYVITYRYENNEKKIKEVKFIAETKDSISSLSAFYNSVMKVQSEFKKTDIYKLLFDANQS